MTTDLTPVIVLAGGASRRMGTDKRLAPIDGQPMLVRTIDRLGDAPVVLVIDPDRPLGIDLPRHVRVIPDTRPGEGPLAALEAGLGAIDDDIVVVVGGDMPWVEPSVLRSLVDRLAGAPTADVVCLADEDGGRPLPLAVRRSSVLARITALLDAGERRLRTLLDHALVVPLATWLALDPTRGSLRDVDTPADLVATR